MENYKMKTIREAIDAGAKTVYLNNGTYFNIENMSNPGLMFGRIKIINGKKVARWLLITVIANDKTDESAIKHRNQYVPELDCCYFNNNDFLCKENEINAFITNNGGIDEYRTGYWISPMF